MSGRAIRRCTGHDTRHRRRPVTPTYGGRGGHCRRRPGGRRRRRRPGRVPRRWSSSTGASCTSTATGCWARTTRPRTRVQETMLRAWRRRDSFDGGPYFRAWLYRIATNTCLDQLRRSHRRAPAGGSFAEVPWLQPYPDVELDQVATHDDQPDAALVARDGGRAGVPAALQAVAAAPAGGRCSPPTCSAGRRPRPRALLDMTVPAANSALQRGRATLRQPLRVRAGPVVGGRTERRRALRPMAEVHGGPRAARPRPRPRRCSATTSASRCHPTRSRFDGIDVVARALETAFGVEEVGDWRLVPIRGPTGGHEPPSPTSSTPNTISTPSPPRRCRRSVNGLGGSLCGCRRAASPRAGPRRAARGPP